MRAGPAIGARSGPFVLPARVVLVGAGIPAIALGVFNLVHERHFGEVDAVYTAVAIAVFVVWLVTLVVAFRGSRAAVFIAGAIGFVEFGIISSTHFVIGPGALLIFVRSEGLPVATADMALVPLSLLVWISAIVCWSHPRGRARNLDTLPVLIVAVIGAILVILQATDDVHRGDFGTANVEDGAFAAAAVASGWIVGALWIARVRRTGAITIALATFVVWYSFVTLHVVSGGTSVSQIASTSGVVWAVAAAGAFVLSGASFLLVLGMLAWSLKRRAAEAPPASRVMRRGA